jgi:hypothetical protein
VAAAAAVADRAGRRAIAATIGPGADYEDLYGDWARLREVGDTGCVLLRPDNYVGFRSAGLPADPSRSIDSGGVFDTPCTRISKIFAIPSWWAPDRCRTGH